MRKDEVEFLKVDLTGAIAAGAVMCALTAACGYFLIHYLMHPAYLEIPKLKIFGITKLEPNQLLHWIQINPIQAHFIAYSPIYAGLVLGGLITFAASRPKKSERHLRGPELKTGTRAIREMQAIENKLMSKAQRRGEVKGIRIGGVHFSRKREVSHFNVVGLPGAGKTVIINSVIAQVIARNERSIIHDPKSDFTSWIYGRKDYQALILGPWDKRCVTWDIASDIDSAEKAREFAALIIPEAKSDAVWSNSARTLLTNILVHIQINHGPRKQGVPVWSWDTLSDFLDQGIDKILDCVYSVNPQFEMIIKKPESGKGLDKTAASVVFTLASSVAWIAAYSHSLKISGRLERDENGRIKNGFSVVKWIKGNYRARCIILKNDANYKEMSDVVFGLFFAVASNYMNSGSMPEINADDPGGIWVILDEYPQLGKQFGKQVQKIEELGRSRGIRVLKAMQDESQLIEIFGNEKGRAQQSIQQTRIYAKTAIDTAKRIADAFGTRTIERLSESYSAGKRSLSKSQQDVSILHASDLTGLEITSAGAQIVLNIDSAVGVLEQKFTSRELTREISAKVIDNPAFSEAGWVYAEQMQSRMQTIRESEKKTENIFAKAKSAAESDRDEEKNTLDFVDR